MEVIIKPDAAAAIALAADLIGEQVRQKPDAVLALPTGATPIPLYRELVRRHREAGLDFARVTTFNLDEYAGIPATHAGSFARYMREHLFSHVNLDPRRCHVPDGAARDLDAAATAYEAAIRAAGGLDLVVLGIGMDGHIAFNEPGSSLGSRTRVKTLTEHTRRDNAAPFGSLDQVPRRVLTMGIATILEGRQVVLLALGEKKAEIVARAIEGPVAAMVPASALQLHRSVKAVLDEKAAGRLVLADEYRQTASR